MIKFLDRRTFAVKLGYIFVTTDFFFFCIVIINQFNQHYKWFVLMMSWLRNNTQINVIEQAIRLLSETIILTMTVSQRTPASIYTCIYIFNNQFQDCVTQLTPFDIIFFNTNLQYNTIQYNRTNYLNCYFLKLM